MRDLVFNRELREGRLPAGFDIDRYLPPRNEHFSRGFAAFGLSTHSCLGSHWADMRLTCAWRLTC